VVLPAFGYVGRLRLIVYRGWGNRVAEARTWLTEHEKETYCIFTFVRNPFDRIVSAFCNKVIEKNILIEDVHFRKKQSWETVFPEEMRNEAVSFKRFLLRYVSQVSDKQIENHFKSQHNTLYGDPGAAPIQFNFIGHMEQFKDDWSRLSELCGETLPYPRVINVSSSKNDFESYYIDEEMVDIVYDRYKNDVVVFGYEDEYRALRQMAAAREEREKSL
jgi:hypothetical protein